MAMEDWVMLNSVRGINIGSNYKRKNLKVISWSVKQSAECWKGAGFGITVCEILKL